MRGSRGSYMGGRDRGLTGTVSAANSLVGSTAGDLVGQIMMALANGNYVVSSPNWDNGAAANAGAATWGDGTRGITGTVSAANSLVGGDEVVALANGNYVVSSPYWDNGAAANAGAATWGDGTRGMTGTVSAANSLVGSRASDMIGLSMMRADQRQLCGEQPLLGQRCGSKCRGSHMGGRDAWDHRDGQRSQQPGGQQSLRHDWL